MKNKFGWKVKLFLGVVLVFFIAAFCVGLVDIFIRYKGDIKMAEVSKTYMCNRKKGAIKVRLDAEEYRLGITRSECRKGKYQLGQQVAVLKHPYLNRIVWPDSRPEFGFGLLLLFFTVVFFYQKYAYQKWIQK